MPRVFHRLHQRVLLLLALLVLVGELHAIVIQSCTAEPEIVTMRENETLYLTTPNYPRSYPSHADCHFIIRAAAASQRLQMNFHDFILEEPLFTNCDDYISVRDGDAESSREIARFCGQVPVSHLVSTSDVLYIHFHSDDIVQTRGFNASFTDFRVPGCPPDWIPYMEYCYVLRSGGQLGVPWVDAQNACALEESNLLSVASAEEYTFIARNFSRFGQKPWVGYTDATTEGVFESLYFKDVIWPNPFPHLSENRNEKDCVLIDFTVTETTGHAVEDCRDRHPYMCKKRQDGSTVIYMAPREQIRQGLVRQSMDYTFWLLILVALILLIVLMCIVFHTFKRKRTNRVSSADADQRLVGGIDSRGPTAAPPNTLQTSESRVENESTAVRTVQPVQPRRPPSPPSHQLQIPTKPTPAPPPTQIPVAATVHQEPEAAQELIELKETPGPSHEEPRHELPQPTYAGPQLPPLGIRETTMGSSTREESFLRTKRIGELFERPKMNVLDNISAISLDEFWHSKQP